MSLQKKQKLNIKSEAINADSEEKMVIDNYGLVVSQSIKFITQKQDLDDYIQIGLIGLLKAIRNYNSEKSKFSTFATVCIRNEILKFIKKQKRQNRRLNLREKKPQETLLWEYQPDNLTKDEIDIIDMKVDDMLYLEDIQLPDGVEIPLLTQEEPNNELVVAIRVLRIAEEEVVEEGELEDGEEGAEDEDSDGDQETTEEESESNSD